MSADENSIHILLVDDYPANLLALEAGLGDLDLHLVKAASGQEALQRLVEADFALVLLDVQMPGMDGFETAARLRNNTRSQNTPIIFVTAIGTDEASIARGYRLGAVDYLVKPFPVEALRAKVLAMTEQFRERVALERRLPAALQQEQVEILAVDDHPGNLLALEEILGDLGEHLVTTPSPREALRLLLKQDFPLVLLDIRMPEISGFELAEMIRQRRPGTQILFMSAVHKAPEDISQGYALGAVDYLFTPFSPDILRGKVQALVDLIKRQRALERQVKEIERLNQALQRSEAALRELNLSLEQQVAEQTQALRESQQWLQTAVRASNTGLWDWNIQTGEVHFSPEWKAQLGYAEGELAGRYEEWEGRLHPEDRDQALAVLKAYMEGSRPDYKLEFRLRHRGGSFRWIFAEASLFRNPEGKPWRMVGSHIDITERKELEQQFLQAQKMEAIGRLAGGMAHDFNNLLTIIGGYSEMLQKHLGPDHPQQARVLEIQKAADRGAGLIRQLLAFSRRQVLEPVVLNLNTVVRDLEKMLCRLIGEDVELVVKLAPDLGQMRADPGQLEQVLVNLAVNARDAMPRGGKLIIETSNVELDETYTAHHVDARPGSYVLLEVSDTGVGMDTQIQAHIFEPFFTTKAPGKGTGLGLSTVYGIVKQSEGYIWVYSEVGQGTSFKIYLPRLEEEAAPAVQAAAALAAGGSETLLLVEDEAPLRGLMAVLLRESGYTVLEASQGEEALQLAAHHQGTIHLVVTDMVMPGMGGRELVERLRTAQLSLKVLYISGYSAEVVERQGSLEPGMLFLQKPFKPDALLLKVRQALDREREGG